MDAKRLVVSPVGRARAETVTKIPAPTSAFRVVLRNLIPRGIVGGAKSAVLPLTPRVGSRPASGEALDRIIRDASAKEGVDESLVRAVVEQESGFRSDAVSRAGAMGLMQLMPGTARTLGVKDPFDPAANVAGGTRYLRTMLDRFGSVPLALAAYNAGPGAVEKYGGVPPYTETKSYVSRVMGIQQRNEIALGSPEEGGRKDEQPIA